LINRDGRYYHEFHEGNWLSRRVHYQGTKGKLEGSYLLAFIVTTQKFQFAFVFIHFLFFSFDGKAKVALPLTIP
jgi:hypothetical protein